MRDSLEWASIKRARRCVACSRDFNDGEGYCSMLFMAAEGLIREDYCTACWDASAPERRAESISHWLGRFRAEPPKQKEELIARSLVERVFRKYIESKEPAHINCCHILALMMERKKKLIPRDRITDPRTGRKITVYELPDTGESFLIEDPGLQLIHAKDVQRQVKELLDAEQAHAEADQAPDTRNAETSNQKL